MHAPLFRRVNYDEEAVWMSGRWLQICWFLICLTILSTLAGPKAVAQDIEFLGETIDAAPGQYLVINDVNIRAKPGTNAKRLGQLKAGEIIDVAGRPPGSIWYALLQNGAPFGFVYGSVLSPILDGQIDDDVTGLVTLDDGQRCGFRIEFIGRTGLQGEGVRTSDYDVSIVCEREVSRIRFPAQMFLTEVPFDGSRDRRIFQINVDLLDGVHRLDDVLSTILLYDLDNDQVRFDAMTEDVYLREIGGLELLPATSVSNALAGALEIAMTQWSAKLWDDIYDQAN